MSSSPPAEPVEYETAPSPGAGGSPARDASPAADEPERTDAAEPTEDGAAAGGIYDEVFGGGGDDSDLSDNEGAPRAAPAKGGRGDDDDDDDDDDDEDTYRPATATSPAKLPKFKKRRGSGDGGDDGDEGDGDEDEERRKRKKRKQEKRDKRNRESREQIEDEDEEPVLDEATQRRLALEERIENIGKKQRVTRRKKKGGEDVDIVDSYHDDVCIRLRDRMLAAAAKDRRANNEKQPATSKLAMLEEVRGVLQNTTLWSSIIDNEVLKAVKLWLEPLDDRSLPAVGIQKVIFEALPKMDLDTATIKEAGLGAIVLFYTKTKRVTPVIRRTADMLVQSWSRPIIKRPADFRNRYVSRDVDGGEERDYDDDADELTERERRDRDRRKRGKAPLKQKRFDVRKALEENESRKGARPLNASETQYTVAPESRTQHYTDDIAHVSRLQQDNKKFNKFARQIKMGKRGGP